MPSAQTNLHRWQIGVTTSGSVSWSPRHAQEHGGFNETMRANAWKWTADFSPPHHEPCFNETTRMNTWKCDENTRGYWIISALQ